MHIELYSIRGFTGNALKMKLEQMLAVHQMPYTIIEINHVDQFIKAGLASIPAFRIGNKVIQHPHDGDVDETVAQVLDYILTEHVNSILVPVDFSDESKLAIAYAAMMAHHLGYSLTLAHVHQTLYDPISAGALDVQFLQKANKTLLELADNLNKENAARSNHVHVTAHVEVGETMSSLTDLLERGHFELMVMATRATDNAIRRLFGTVSSNVSRTSNKPVIVVPPQTEIKFPGKVVVGFTEELMTEGTLEYILSFGSKYNVFYDFVHVTDDQRQFDVLKSKLYEKLAINRPLLTGFNIISIHPDEMKIHESIFQYAVEVRASMVVLISHHRTFMKNITHTSVTKRALQNPLVPLMIIHTPVSRVKH